MIDNCTYDKVKLIHDLSSIAWFLENHCEKDLKKSHKNNCCSEVIKNIKSDLSKHIDALWTDLKKCE